MPLSEAQRDDFNFVMSMVKREGFVSAECASKRLRDDATAMMAFTKIDRDSFMFASKRLKDDRGFLIDLVKVCAYSLEFASERLRKDPEVVLAAVKKTAWSLSFADESVRDNPEVVLAAVKKNNCALKYASDRLKGDAGIILAAVKYAKYEWCGKSIKSVDRCIASDGYILEWVRLSRLGRRTRRARKIFVDHFVAQEREAKLKAKVDLWLTKNELGHWIEACGREFKESKKRKREE